MTDTTVPLDTTLPPDTTQDITPPSPNPWPDSRRVQLAGAILYAIEGLTVLFFIALYILRKRGNAVKVSIKTTFFFFALLHAVGKPIQTTTTKQQNPGGKKLFLFIILHDILSGFHYLSVVNVLIFEGLCILDPRRLCSNCL